MATEVSYVPLKYEFDPEGNLCTQYVVSDTADTVRVVSLPICDVRESGPPRGRQACIRAFSVRGIRMAGVTRIVGRLPQISLADATDPVPTLEVLKPLTDLPLQNSKADFLGVREGRHQLLLPAVSLQHAIIRRQATLMEYLFAPGMPAAAVLSATSLGAKFQVSKMTESESKLRKTTKSLFAWSHLTLEAYRALQSICCSAHYSGRITFRRAPLSLLNVSFTGYKYQGRIAIDWMLPKWVSYDGLPDLSEALPMAWKRPTPNMPTGIYEVADKHASRLLSAVSMVSVIELRNQLAETVIPIQKGAVVYRQRVWEMLRSLQREQTPNGT